MGTRIGFMESKKAGRCYYCKEEIPVSEPPDNKVICGYDNNVKRRICKPCGMQICETGGDAVVASPPADDEKSKPKDEVLEKLNQVITTLGERIARLEEFITGEGS